MDWREREVSPSQPDIRVGYQVMIDYIKDQVGEGQEYLNNLVRVVLSERGCYYEFRDSARGVLRGRRLRLPARVHRDAARPWSCLKPSTTWRSDRRRPAPRRSVSSSSTVGMVCSAGRTRSSTTGSRDADGGRGTRISSAFTGPRSCPSSSSSRWIVLSRATARRATRRVVLRLQPHRSASIGTYSPCRRRRHGLERCGRAAASSVAPVPTLGTRNRPVISRAVFLRRRGYRTPFMGTGVSRP